MKRPHKDYEELLNKRMQDLAEEYNISIKHTKELYEIKLNRIYEREIKKYNGLDPGGLRTQSLNVLERYLKMHQMGFWKKVLTCLK